MHLTTDEIAILCALANGAQSKTIAAQLNRSRATIEAHIRDLYDKLDARTRPQLVARAFRLGILRNDA